MEDLLQSDLRVDQKTINIRMCLKDKQLILLYFGANWVPQCRYLLRELKEFYKKVESEDTNLLEVVYISDDIKREVFEQIFN